MEDQAPFRCPFQDRFARIPLREKKARLILLLHEVIYLYLSSEICNTGPLELFQSLSDSFVADMHCLDDLSCCALETVISRCDENRSTAKTVWSTTIRHPITLHSLDKSQCRNSHIFCFFAEFELRAESVNKKRWVDKWDLQMQKLDEFNIARTENV